MAHLNPSLFALLLAALPLAAHAYDFGLDDLTVTGQAAFHDDFADGSRAAPPTSSLVDLAGTTSEAGGVLVLSDADGYAGGGAIGQDSVALSLLLSDGGGDSTAVATFAAGLPTQDFEAYGLGFANAGQGSFLIGIVMDSAGTFGTPCSGLYVLAQNGANVTGCDAVDPGAVTSGIVFSLHLDDASNLVSGAYSIDGGTTFIAFASWDVAPSAALAFTNPSANTFYYVLAQGVVPEPSLASLLVLGGVGASVWRRRLCLGA